MSGVGCFIYNETNEIQVSLLNNFDASCLMPTSSGKFLSGCMKVRWPTRQFFFQTEGRCCSTMCLLVVPAVNNRCCYTNAGISTSLSMPLLMRQWFLGPHFLSIF